MFDLHLQKALTFRRVKSSSVRLGSEADIWLFTFDQA
jgi:hypothetical protein